MLELERLHTDQGSILERHWPCAGCSRVWDTKKPYVVVHKDGQVGRCLEVLSRLRARARQ